MHNDLIKRLAASLLDDEIVDAQGRPTGIICWDEDSPDYCRSITRDNDDAQRLLDDAIRDAREIVERASVTTVAVAIMDGLHQDNSDLIQDASYYDRAYNMSDSGFPGVWELCARMAAIGVATHGEAWASGEREFVDDIQAIMPLVFGGQDGEFVGLVTEAWKKL